MVKTISMGLVPHVGDRMMKSNGKKCPGCRNHISSTRIRSHPFHASFREMLAIEPLIADSRALQTQFIVFQLLAKCMFGVKVIHTNSKNPTPISNMHQLEYNTNTNKITEFEK